MRWNGLERSVGELVAAVVLLAAALTLGSPPGSVARLRVGMTEAEVADALGTPGLPHPDRYAYLAIHGPGVFGPDGAERYREYLREVRRTNSQFYRQYRLPFCVVDVYFRGIEGDERVVSGEARRSLAWGRSLAASVFAALALGLLAAEAARRFRSRARPVPAP